MPIDYYSSMIGCLIDQRVFFDLLEQRFPELADHIKSTNFDLSVIVVRWLVCLLCLEVNQETSLAIWDLFMLKGPKIIFQCMLAIFMLMKPQIMKMNEMTEIWMFLKEFPSNDLDLTLLMALIDHQKVRVSNTEIAERRDRARVDVSIDLNEKMIKKVQELNIIIA